MSRSQRILVAILSILAIPAVLCLSLPETARAGTQVVELPLDAAWSPERPSGRHLASFAADPTRDRDLAPTLTWWWALSDGERIAAADLDVARERVLADLDRSPQRLPLVGSEGGAARTTPGPLHAAGYSLRVSEPRLLHGRRFQSIELVPLREAEGRLLGLQEASLRLELAPAPSTGEVLRPERADFPLRSRVLATLGDGLLNPEVLPAEPLRAVGGGDFPTEVPSIEGSVVEMVVVTVDSFADLCQAYAEQRTDAGVPTVVRSLEWIRDRYPYGSDRPELVRRFLQDAYAKWSLRYALIVGDAEHFPARYAYSEIFIEPRTLPTDLYFSCLDGDWNDDHDNFWAEPADSAIGLAGDGADMLPEIAVGRLPASDYSECAVMLDKASQYATGAGNYHDRILLLGEVLFPIDYPTNPNIIIDGAAFCDSIHRNATDGDHHVTALYENNLSYPGSLPLSVESATDSMNYGQNIVLHNGHGYRQSMSVADGSIDPSIVTHLENGDETFLLYMVNCTAAAFDFNCLAEDFLANAGGGAHAVIGSTRETFATTAASYSDVFFDLLYTDASLRLGEVVTGTIAAFPTTSEDNGYRWTSQTFTLLGDPSLWIHYRRTDRLVVTVPETVELGGAVATILVEKLSGGPRPDAEVTLHKTGDDYQRAITDAAGEASFDLAGTGAGLYEVVVSGRDVLAESTSFPVTTPASEALLSIASVTVDDLSGGMVQGNGNGIAERGETVRVALELRNRGGVDATGVTAQLVCGHADIALLDDTDSFGTLPAHGLVSGLDPFLLTVGDGGEDDEIFPFTVLIDHDAGQAQDEFFLEAAAPELKLYLTTINDSLGGDGDGELELGETATVTVAFSNRGRGAAQSVTAHAQDVPASGATVLAGTDPLGDLAPLTTELAPAQFSVERTGEAAPVIQVLLEDLFAHVDSLYLVLSAPVGTVDPPTYELSSEVHRLRLHWTPPTAGDAAAYAVYRAGAAGGPYARISSDWVESSTYEDENLAPYTSYWYRLRSINASGMLGAFGDSSKVTTNPAQKRGWPASLLKETPSTPVIGDVDGDRIYEVIVGSNLVHGFDHQGFELSDGDADPLTDGPVFDLGDNFFCSMAASDLTPSPGIEVVACSWNTAEVFLLEFTDTPTGAVVNVADGWPREVAAAYGIWGSPGLADVDGDEDLEIFVCDIGGTLNAWNHDGTDVNSGIGFRRGTFASGLGGWTRSTPSFADIDDDGDQEIFIGSRVGHLKGYDGDGEDLPGFPFVVGADIYCAPSIGEIDGDPQPEIAFVAENDSVYVINHDGTRVPGWPVPLVNQNWALAPSIALADIDGDERVELFVCGIHTYEIMDVGWLDGDGQWMSGWPIEAAFSSQSSPVVGDLDGDGDLETVLGNENASIEAWHHDASPVDGFPIFTGDYVRAVPSLVDLDRDGNLDMVLAGWDKGVYVWEFPVVHDPELTPWYTFNHDQKRSGNAGQMDWVVEAEEGQPLPADVVRLDAAFPNPFNPETRIRFRIGGERAQAARLEVYDVQGRLRRVLLDERLEPGEYLRTWDGRDEGGRPLASGLYFARLRVDDRVETRKMTLLK